MKTIWTVGLDEQAKKEAKQEFDASGRFREHLIRLIQDKIETKRTASRSDSKYESPSWALLQADAVGYEKALFEVISIIS